MENYELFIIKTVDVDCTQSLGCLFNFKFNIFSIFKSLVVTKIFYVVAVYKNIFATFVGLDESISFFNIKPFYCTLLHNNYSSV